MKIFFDTEFLDLGSIVYLVSIGLVREDGREYYAEVAEHVQHYDKAVPWVRDNVLKHLTGEVKPMSLICDEIEDFAGKRPEFWAYYASYDWMCLCSLYGGMLQVPTGWPHFCRDLLWYKMQQVDKHGGIAVLLPQQDTVAHNALNDARWNLQVYRYLEELDKR